MWKWNVDSKLNLSALHLFYSLIGTLFIVCISWIKI